MSRSFKQVLICFEANKWQLFIASAEASAAVQQG